MSSVHCALGVSARGSSPSRNEHTPLVYHQLQMCDLSSPNALRQICRLVLFCFVLFSNKLKIFFRKQTEHYAQASSLSATSHYHPCPMTFFHLLEGTVAHRQPPATLSTLEGTNQQQRHRFCTSPRNCGGDFAGSHPSCSSPSPTSTSRH